MQDSLYRSKVDAFALVIGNQQNLIPQYNCLTVWHNTIQTLSQVSISSSLRAAFKSPKQVISKTKDFH